jgi:putative inorganic carbon (HCO3(-)) transporter
METIRMRIEKILPTEQHVLVIILMSVFSSVLLGIFTTSQDNWLPLAGVMLFSLLLLALIWAEAATLTVVFALYTNMLVVASIFHNVPQVLAASFILMLVIPLANYIILQRKPLVITPALPLIIVWLLVLVLSALFSQSVNASVPSIQLFITEGLLLYFLVSNVIRTPATLRRVIWVLLLAGSLMGALSLYQELTRSYSNNFGGFAQISNFGFKDGDPFLGFVRRPRLGGPIGEQNRYAQVMIVLLPLALFRFWGERSGLLRVFAAAATFLILSAILLTFSRGAAVALLGLFVIMIVWRYIRLHQAALMLLTLIVLIATIAPDYILRLDTIRSVQGLFSDEGEDPDGAIRGRFQSNLAALNAFLDHPVLGVGPGQYAKQYSRQYGNAVGIKYFDTIRRAHNLYLEVAADTGLIGFVSFMTIVMMTMIHLWRSRRYWLHRHPEFANMATALLLSLMAYLMTAVFLHLSYERYYWFLLALANSAIYMLQRETIAAEAAEEVAPAGDYRYSA